MELLIIKINTREIQLPNFREIKYTRKLVTIKYDEFLSFFRPLKERLQTFISKVLDFKDLHKLWRDAKFLLASTTPYVKLERNVYASPKFNLGKIKLKTKTVGR